MHLSQVLGSFEQIAAWVQANREYTECEQMVAVGRQVRKVRKARKEIAGEVEGLRKKVARLEDQVRQQQGQLERSYAVAARLEEQYVQARARCVEEVARVRAEVLGGAPSGLGGVVWVWVRWCCCLAP
ncbi:hypothetical protein [Rothia sp. ZJ932]|uniref:hypothetical protein n=1 Tax=Rothia sp. ZJ932 TaxID=2810516 RepID=UPI0019671807|nr:hypothetical protein [Rothia sp. ZJ932]QRZ60975.1 hypothetical protein JR346_06825 [Rothia sp. ZJ932]